MLQKTYSIYSDDLNRPQLSIEIGKNHLACWCTKSAEKKFAAFEFFQCEDYDASDFENLINQVKLYSKLLTLDVSETMLTWISDKKLIIPSTFNADENFIRNNFILMYGSDDADKLITRSYEDYLIVTNIEKYLYNAAKNVFPKADFQSACQVIKTQENGVQLFFYPNYFCVIVYKNNKLHFFQNRFFTHPQDVLYVLLNIMQQYQIEKSTEIIIGGYIDEHSSLYEILHQYFEGLQLGVVDETLFLSPEFKDYPQHYFLPYVNYLV